MSMLVLDTVFFVVELGGGIYAHSLALQADAFHMVRVDEEDGHMDSIADPPQLNDIISLAIGYGAVRAASRPSSDTYTYGVSIHRTLARALPPPD